MSEFYNEVKLIKLFYNCFFFVMMVISNKFIIKLYTYKITIIAFNLCLKRSSVDNKT